MQWVLRDSAGEKYSDCVNGKDMTQKEVIEKLELMGGLMSRSTTANIS